MKKVTFGLLATLAATQIFASSTYEELFKSRKIDKSELIKLDTAKLDKVQRQVFEDLLKSVSMLGYKKSECDSSRVIKAEQLHGLGISNEHYNTVLIYFYGLNRKRCEESEYNKFAKLIAVNLASQKDSEVLEFITNLNRVGSAVYYDYAEAEVDFKQLPKSVQDRTSEVSFLKEDFNLFESLQNAE
ncbi:hypothetical protein CKO50_13050 [Pseudoalteromonas sp. HM-SA03]|uniref:hypothetical protein n=1 Tax=Pseudoalteromonas sp. HM-SA03 TaxID=2029678 RepID=UPI000BAE10E1|nr:hypothetical protein [Pseudoalteromonas sp. HM-SA03]PAY00905.1 hypothetical protein CKO50_13050 [Pseudoalteromonas sp. HM-SA03]